MNFPFSSLSDAHGMWAAVALYSLNFAATGNMNSMSTCSCLSERIQGQADQWTLVFNQSKSMLVYSTETASRKDVNPVLGLQTAQAVSWLLKQFAAAVNKSWTYCICLPSLNKCPFFGCAPCTGGPQGLIHAIPEFSEGTGRAEQREFQDVNSLFSSDWPRTNAGYSKLSLSA